LDNGRDYVEKWSYVRAIHSQHRFCKLKMYAFKTFVSLLSEHASYVYKFMTAYVKWIRDVNTLKE
jgi:hypothetical protein